MKTDRQNEILRLIENEEIETQEELANRLREMSDSTLSVDYAGQMVVIKTLSGSANVAAEAIDTMNWKEVLGTIAGDNTIFLAVPNENDTAEIADRIRKLAGKE